MKKLVGFLICLACFDGAQAWGQNNCATPTGFELAGVAPKAIYLKWNPTPGAKSYVVTYGATNVSPTVWTSKVVCAPGWFMEIDGLKPGVPYAFQIKANCTTCYNAANTGVLSPDSGNLSVKTQDE